MLILQISQTSICIILYLYMIQYFFLFLFIPYLFHYFLQFFSDHISNQDYPQLKSMHFLKRGEWLSLKIFISDKSGNYERHQPRATRPADFESTNASINLAVFQDVHSIYEHMLRTYPRIYMRVGHARVPIPSHFSLAPNIFRSHLRLAAWGPFLRSFVNGRH